ncbi:MAG: hypothetical protein PVI95_01725 [Dehalococcoidia bacterium]
MKLYFKSILVKSQLTVPIPLWNVIYRLNQQISGEILKDDLVKVKHGVWKMASVATVYIDLTARNKERIRQL